MKFDIKSLHDYVKLKVSATQLADLYTNAGLEVEAIDGNILDLKVPPNRADCLCFKGVAREAAALTSELFIDNVIPPVNEEITDTIDLQVRETTACPKYLGRIIQGVDNTVETPKYIKEALDVAEISCISPVVDITNYVMLKLGQPLHAFDLQRVNGAITVRYAKNGEKITLLDGSTRELQNEMLVIADNKQPLAIAGVMGGDQSAIIPETKDLILECAYFDPVGIRLTARKLGIQTDSSYRFERCIDPGMQLDVMEYVTNLLLEIVGGKAGPIAVSEDHTNLPQPIELNLRTARLTKLLGINITTAACAQILRSLGMDVRPAGDLADITVGVPLFRQDIEREVDLIEEVARINGYDKIPVTTTVASLDFVPRTEGLVAEQQIQECLLNRGYQEAITYSFIDSELAHEFAENVSDAWCLTNPIANDMNMMRPSLIPGLIQALQYNLNRQQSRVRLFEIGLRFVGGREDLQQIKTIAGVCTGTYFTEGWAQGNRAVDFFDLKHDVCALFNLPHRSKQVEFLAADNLCLQPGQNADIIFSESKAGMIGALHPALQKSLGIEQPVYVFEIDYNVIAQGEISNFVMFSKYPAVRRDLALLVDRELPVGVVQQAVRKQVGDLLTDLVIFDVYEGRGVPEGRKSLGLGLTLQDNDRTLHDKDVNDIFARLVNSLENEFNAVLR